MTVSKRLTGCLFLFAAVLAPAFSQSATSTFIFLNTNPDKPDLPKDQVDSLMAGHLTNISRMAQEGKLLIAGPFYNGGGIFVLSTTSPDTAWKWLRSDPAIRANRWNIEMFPYKPRIGSICPVSEPYEMVGYGFVRFSRRENTRETESESFWNRHLEYVRSIVPTDSIVAIGMLGQEESILVMRGEPDEELLRRTPDVQNGNLQMILKMLWIARGSFCEK